MYYLICLPNLIDSIKYGTTTISSAGSQINVNPPRIPKKTNRMNMSEALKKLKNIGSHITISKKVVAEARAESSDVDDNLDNDYDDPSFDGAAIGIDSDDNSNNTDDPDYIRTSRGKSPALKSFRIKRTKATTRKTNGPNKSKYSIKVDGPPVFLCMKCNIKFQTFVELKQHLAGTNDCNMSEYVCTICQRLCETKKVLTQHMKSHEAKKSEQCDQCGKSFANHYVLENHKLIQHGECKEEFSSTYKCRLCNGKFNSRADLYAHTKNHEAKTDADGQQCDKCGKVFANSHNLSNHIRLHLDHRPFPCELRGHITVDPIKIMPLAHSNGNS